MLLGGTGKSSMTIQRDITEIEQKLLDGLFRIILQDLREAWKAVTNVDFTIEAMETEPQLLHLLAPNEAVVSIGIEVRIGESRGHDEHRHALDRHQDDAPEVRPAMVGAQDACQRSRAAPRAARCSAQATLAAGGPHGGSHAERARPAGPARKATC